MRSLLIFVDLKTQQLFVYKHPAVASAPEPHGSRIASLFNDQKSH